MHVRVCVAYGSDLANDCFESADPCATIQHGIDEASAGATIEVSAGTYSENLTIPQSLTLRGPNAGVDPNTGSRGDEAMIDGGSGTAIDPGSAGIVIDGFTISTDGAGSPIYAVGSDVDGLTISNDIVGSGVAAVRLEVGGDQIAIERNLIAGKGYGVFLGHSHFGDLAINDNVVTGPVDYYGVFNDGGGTFEGLQFEGNTIQAPSNIGGTVTNGVVSGNRFDVDSPGGMNFQIDLHDSTVSGNSFQGHGTTACLQLFGSQYGLDPSEDVTVSGNSFEGCNAFGIQLSPEIDHIDITGNTISGSYDGVNTRSNDLDPWDLTSLDIDVFANRITGSTHMGVDNTVDGTLDARDNWWGCNAGPGAAGCDGAGANVDISPNVVLTGAASKSELLPGASAVVIARLDTNSAGAGVDGVPGGTVAFGAQLGALSPTSAALANGAASSTFTADSRLGPAGITVGLDSQRVGVPLKVASPVAPPASEPAIEKGAKQVIVQGRNLVLGTLACGASACKVGSKTGVAKVHGKKFKVRVRVPASIAAGASAPIKVVLPKSVMKALAKSKTGTVRVKITLTESSGRTLTRTFRVKIRKD